MCFKIRFDNRDTKSMSYTAAYLMDTVKDVRNGDYLSDKSLLEVILRRGAGAVGFAVCIVAAVVEHVFRAALGLVLILPTLIIPCCWEKGKPTMAKNFAIDFLINFGLIGDLALRNVYAFVQNFCEETIDLDDLKFCELSDCGYIDRG